LTLNIDGEFGAMMLVDIANDGKKKNIYGKKILIIIRFCYHFVGPVTLELDSRKFTYDEQK
jgi:hypothetical protein